MGKTTCQRCNGEGKAQSPFIGLIEPMDLPGCEIGSGSMGYGLPFGVGFALAKELKKEEGTVYVIMSDGEMAIGTTWESALIAAHHKLDNLVVIVDYNGFQAMGKINKILRIDYPQSYDPEEITGTLFEKWQAFHWNVDQISGHKYEEIKRRLFPDETEIYNWQEKKRPSIIIAKTIKGKGVSFMENDNSWHYRRVDDVSYELATKELGQ